MPIAIIISFILFFQNPVQESKPQLLRSSGQNFEWYTLDGYRANTILQQQDGTLWIGTANGAIKFDGYEWVAFKEMLSDSVSQFRGDNVISIMEDSYKNIWAGTQNNTFNILRKGTTRFNNFSEYQDGITISPYTIIEEKSGLLWANTKDMIMRFNYIQEKDTSDHGVWITVRDKFEFINKLFISSSGRIYALGDGLYELRYSEQYGIEVNKLFDGTYLSDMIEMSGGDFLIANTTKLIYWRPGSVPELIRDEIAGERWVYTLYLDSNRTLWMGHEGGINSYKWNVNKTLIQRKEYSLPSVNDIIEDQSGNIFFASNLGLLKLSWKYDQYEYISLPEDFSEEYTYKNFTDKYGNYWVGGNNGLLFYNTSSSEFETKISSERIFGIMEDEDENIWVSTAERIAKFDINSGDLKKSFEIGFNYNTTRDHLGNLWVIQYNELMKIDPRQEKLIRFKEIPHSVNKIFIDSDNVLWLVDLDRGLMKMDISSGSPELIKRVKPEAINRDINWVEDDGIGNLWMSSRKGVIVIDKERMEVEFIMDSNTGLPVDDTFELIRDHSGTIWIKQATYGSTAVNPETREVISFTPSWLRRPKDSGFYCVNAVDRNGNLFTDGRGGFFVFHPDSISGNKVAPKVILNEAQVNDEMSFSSDLRYNQNDVEFHYVGIQLDAPSRNEYAYYLEGYDTDWNFVKDQRIARYLSLPPGDYTFYVKASNSDGIWSEETQLAAFTILPPLWKTNFAYLFYLLVLAGVSFAFYRTQLNRRLAESEAGRLKELDEFKSRFFTNISHEFRTPLTVISGLANRIQDQSGVVIKRNSQKLLGLINQILELSKLESSTSKLNLIQVDILSYTNYLIQSFSSYAEENEIRLNLDSDQEEITIDFDKDKYDLIIQNLLSNAIKFTGKGGVIDLFMTSEKETLLIEISDTGIGIDEKDIPKLFDRFYQVEITHSNNQGSGIGLSLTKELVKLMNGTISVESVVGEGTTFQVSLPITRTAIPVWIDDLDDIQVLGEHATSKTMIKVASKEHDDKKDLVLLVEDNEDVREFVYSVISKDYSVVTAVDGNEGIRKAKELIPDMIISDVMMPGSDGIELTGTLKQYEPTSHIPIILLTAKSDIESRLSGLKTGADIYLSKPFNESELLIHLQNLMAQRQRIRAKYNQSIEEEKIEDEFILKVNNTILEHLGEEEYGIEEVCKEIGVSRTQLHRKLKALTGKSTSIFIRDIRLNEGRKLLKTTSLNIAEIAYKVGFGDPNYFSKLYSEKYDHSPTKERETVV